jgi:chromosome segregation ATPase
MLNKIFLALGILLLLISFSAAIGLGVWAYTLDVQLNQVQAQYQALKASDDRLNQTYNALNADSGKLQANLQAAQSQLSDTQDQLKKVQGQEDQDSAKITAIQSKVSVLYAFQFGSETSFDTKVNASGDDELKKLWATAKDTKSRDDFLKLWEYLIQSVADTAGIRLPLLPLDSGPLSG